MAGFDKRVMIKLFLSLLAIAIAATYLLSDIAHEGQGRMRDSAVDGQHSQRSLLNMRRRRGWNGKKRASFVSIMDPKSTAPRVDDSMARAKMFVDAETRASQGSGGVDVRIEGPTLETKFPFHTTDSDHCVSREEINSLSVGVRRLLEGHVRVFPRNGFLLGIVRHGGFLPTEHVDADLGIVASDLTGLSTKKVRAARTKGSRPVGARTSYRAAGFLMVAVPTETYWKNWYGLDPATGEPYDFTGVNLHGSSGNLQANSVYEYRDTGKFFFPWLTTPKNHMGALFTAKRYNEEGADIRILDTDERLDRFNYRKEAQMGTVLDTDLTCFVEKQFYYTTIPVPCDYDAILTAQYGRNWHHVESRGDVAQDDGMETKMASLRVSEEANDALLQGGPRPICIQ